MHECGNHGRYYVLKSISKKYLQEHPVWTKLHIERIIKVQLNEHQLPENIYHYETTEEDSKDNLINAFNDIVIINSKSESTTKQFSIFQPLLGYPNYQFCYKEPIQSGISTLLIKSDIEERNPSIQITDENLYAYIIINGILKSAHNKNYENYLQ